MYQRAHREASCIRKSRSQSRSQEFRCDLSGSNNTFVSHGVHRDPAISPRLNSAEVAWIPCLPATIAHIFLPSAQHPPTPQIYLAPIQLCSTCPRVHMARVFQVAFLRNRTGQPSRSSQNPITICDYHGRPTVAVCRLYPIILDAIYSSDNITTIDMGGLSGVTWF